MGADAQEAVPNLISLLKAPEDNVRRAAAKALEHIGPPAKADYGVLVTALSDATVEVRLYAARTLAKVESPPPQALKGLTTALRDAEAPVRQHAIVALGKLAADQRERVVPVVLDALGDSDGRVRQLSSELLGKLALEPVKDFPILKVAVTHKNPEVRSLVVDVLARGDVSREFSSVLASALKDEEPKIRLQGIVALGRCRPNAKEIVRPLLLDGLSDKDKALRQAALSSLKRIGPPSATEVDTLAGSLKSATVEVWLYAIYALSQLGVQAKAAVTAMSQALEDTEPQVCYVAAETLGKVGPGAKAAAPSLLRAIKGSDKVLRRAALAALGKIGRVEGSLQGVVAVLADEDDEVRQSALAALGNLGPWSKADVPILAPALKIDRREVRLAAMMALEQIGPEAAPSLVGMLSTRDSVIRARAVKALGALRAKQTVPQLAEALAKETDTQLRQDIADALGNLGPDAKDAVPALAGVLLGNDSALRARAATALGAIGPEAKAAVPKLVVALEDKSSLESVVAALAKIGKPAVPGLTNALTDKNPVVRLGATVALGQIGSEARSAVPALSLRYTKDRYLEVREAARIALKKIHAKE